MIYNTTTKTLPYLAHAPGKLEFCPDWAWLVKRTSDEIYEKPKNLAIITFNNGKTHNNKIAGTFENQLLSNGIKDFNVLGNNVENWQNRMKIELLKDFLPNIKEEYILISDSCDVLTLRNIQNILKDFLKLSCKAVFNGEVNQWPPMTPEDIVAFEKEKGLFLNAGLWICEKSFCSKILDLVLELSEKIPTQTSEQFFYKFCYRKMYPEVQVDSSCKLFQWLNRLKPNTLKETKEFF